MRLKQGTQTSTPANVVGAELGKILQSGAGGTHMSMMGRFVQVSQDRLKQIIDDPSGVEELFAGDQAAQAMPNLIGAMQERIKGHTPQMLAASIAAMPPEVRERYAQSMKNLGFDPDALARGEGVDDLEKLMTARIQDLGGLLSAKRPA